MHICEVELDPETGVTRVDKWTCDDDFGAVINPLIVEGQISGGVAQGIGQALLEAAIYNKDGQLVTASFMDYAMPRADDVPSFTHRLQQCAAPSNPARDQGLRRGRRDRRASGGDQRHHRCARP